MPECSTCGPAAARLGELGWPQPAAVGQRLHRWQSHAGPSCRQRAYLPTVGWSMNGRIASQVGFAFRVNNSGGVFLVCVLLGPSGAVCCENTGLRG